jgi:hypothetical protein
VSEPGQLWHVTITLRGEPHDPSKLQAALERLQHERPFLHSVRFERTSVELQYWEEAEDMLDAASLAMRVWYEHRESCGLPDWKLVGMEVLERDLLQRRTTTGMPSAIGVPGARPRPL